MNSPAGSLHCPLHRLGFGGATKLDLLINIWPFVVILGEFALKLALISFILTRRRMNPATSLAWIVVMFALPLLGMVLYLLIGETRIARRRIKQHESIVARIRSMTAGSDAPVHRYRHAWVPSDYTPIALLAESVARNPVRPGNRLTLVGDTDVFVQSLVEDIDAAELHCHLLFYIYLPDHSGRRVAEALMNAERRGVECRVLVDSVGSKQLLRSDLARQMRDAGVQVVEALPVNALRALFHRIDLRNHRKIVVIDGHIGYTGSHNLADPEFGIKKRYAPWVDAAMRIDGPATGDLQALFVEDWYLDTDEALADVIKVAPGAHDDGAPVQIMGTGPDTNNEALRQLVPAMIHAAREELILTTPYFVPDESTLLALAAAGRRGVETTLVVPARNDSPLVAAASRGYYDMMLEADVRVAEYTGGLLHAKTMTIDRNLAIVSTANLDRRSFDLNFEVSSMIYDSDFASELRLLQKSYLNQARIIRADVWRARPWRVRLTHNAAGLLSPLL